MMAVSTNIERLLKGILEEKKKQTKILNEIANILSKSSKS